MIQVIGTATARREEDGRGGADGLGRHLGEDEERQRRERGSPRGRRSFRRARWWPAPSPAPRRSSGRGSGRSGSWRAGRRPGLQVAGSARRAGPPSRGTAADRSARATPAPSRTPRRKPRRRARERSSRTKSLGSLGSPFTRIRRIARRGSPGRRVGRPALGPAPRPGRRDRSQPAVAARSLEPGARRFAAAHGAATPHSSVGTPSDTAVRRAEG